MLTSVLKAICSTLAIGSTSAVMAVLLGFLGLSLVGVIDGNHRTGQQQASVQVETLR